MLLTLAADQLSLRILDARLDDLAIRGSELELREVLAGEDESTVFPEPEAAPETPAPAEEPKRERQPGRPRPFPLPGATMQPPPDPAKS